MSKEIFDARGARKRSTRAACWSIPVMAAILALAGAKAEGMGGGSKGPNAQPDQITITGTVTSGGNLQSFPLPEASISIHQVQAGSSVLVGRSETDDSGRFSVRLKRANGDGIYYAIAKRGGKVKFMADLGPKPLTSVHINELTTVAASYAYAQFFKDGLLVGPKLSLEIASGMAQNIVDSVSGTASTVITTSPNAHETNAWSMLGTLGNILAGCVQGLPGACKGLWQAAETDTKPNTTLEATINIAQHPGTNVSALFALGEASMTYSPALTPAQGPDEANDPHMRLSAWTMALKFNRSSNDGTCPFGGPGNLVFDAEGYAWITNNVVQGTGQSANCAIVLQPNGQPADGTDNTPISPIIGGGIVGVGYGIARDVNGNVWFGNFGWGGVLPNPIGPLGLRNLGSVSEFSPLGEPLSPSKPESPYNGFIGGTDRVQAIAVDRSNNVWMASFGNNAAAVFPNGDAVRAIIYQDSTNTTPFGMAVDQSGSGWVAFRGSDSIVKLRLHGNKLKKEFTVKLDPNSSPKGIALDSSDNLWVPGGGTDRVYLVSNDGASVTPFRAAGLNGPWGLSVDAQDNVWVANFGGVVDGGTMYRLVEVCGEAGHCPAGAQTGDAISPHSGYTLPSGGDQVLLASGEPLYGPSNPPEYRPMMRTTSANVDRAGNVWVANNWKPNTFNDVFFNPGGDGIVVFVGLGAPTQFGPADCPGGNSCSPR